MDTRTDNELVEAIQEGEIFAFEALVERYQQKLFYFVFRYVKDDQAAQDVVQESFINFYKTVGRVDTKRKISSYLYSIVRNQAISYLRSIHSQVSLDAIEEHESDFDTEEEFIQQENKEELQKKIHELDPKYAQVLTLYYFDELSYEEMSKVLHVPVNTIRTHIRRAKDALGKLINHETH